MSTAGAQRPVEATSGGLGDARSFWLALLCIVALGVLVRVLYTLLEAPWPPARLDDQFYFSALPKLVADGQGWVGPFAFAFNDVSRPTAEHPPFHSVLLSGLAELGITSPDGQRLTGTLFGAGTIATVGALGRRLAGSRAGLIAAGLAAVYPVLIAADGALMSESLFGLLVALSLLGAYRLAEAPTVGRAVALGAVLGLAALTRGEALLLLPLLLVGVVRRPLGGRAALAALLTCAVVLTPWTIRNWIEFDRPVLIATSAGSAIGGANCAETYHGDQLGGWRPQCVQAQSGNEAEALAAARNDGLRYARDNLGRLPVVLAVRFARVWSVYDPAQLPEGRSERAQKLGLAGFYLLLPAALGGVLVLRRRHVAVWPLLAPFILVCVTALVTYGNPRFREPADVALVVLAAVALDALWRRREVERTRVAPS